MNSYEMLDEQSITVLEDLRRQRDQDERYITPHDQPKRTIILLGRSGVGKTTIANVISDSLYCPPTSLLHHPTEHPKKYQIGGLCIFDTPDIFDQRNQPSKCRITDHRLLIDEFEILFTDNIAPLFGLVFNIQQGINSDDITALLNFKSKFERFSQQMMLILTYCEEKLEDQRQELIDEFFEHSHLVNTGLRRFFGRGVLFMGSIRRESLESCNRKALLFEHNHVLEMRREFIRRCQEKQNVIAIPSNYKAYDRHYSILRQCRNIVRRMGWKRYLLLCPVISIAIFMYLHYIKDNVEVPEPIDILQASPPFIITPLPQVTDSSSIVYFERGLSFGSVNATF